MILILEKSTDDEKIKIDECLAAMNKALPLSFQNTIQLTPFDVITFDKFRIDLSNFEILIELSCWDERIYKKLRLNLV